MAKINLHGKLTTGNFILNPTVYNSDIYINYLD